MDISRISIWASSSFRYLIEQSPVGGKLRHNPTITPVPLLGAVIPNPTCSLVLLEVFLGQAEVMAYLMKEGLTDLLDEFFFG